MTTNSYNEGINTAALIVECAPIGTSHGELAAQIRALSTPNAPVEPAGLRSLRHLLAHMPDKDLHLRRFDAQQLLQFIDAILAVRLDESAIRKDEREKFGFVQAMDIAERGFETWVAKDHNAKWVRHIDGTPIKNDLLVNIAEAFRSAIRNGGKQP